MRRALTATAVALLVFLLGMPLAGAASTKDVASQIAAAQKRANAAAARLNQANETLNRTINEMERLEAEAAAAKARVDGLESRVQSIAVQQYVQGLGQTTVGRGDPNQLARQQALVAAVSRGSRDDLDEYRVARDDLAANTEAMRKRTEKRKAEAAAARKQRTAVESELAKLQTLMKELEARQAAEAKARGRARPAASRSAATPAGPIAKGSWICPVQGPRAFSNDWGQPRSGGRRHQGNDMMAPHGTPVVASVSGTVRHHNSGLGGLSYYLNGDDGNTYFGTHLSSFGNAGRVAAGTIVGYVGATGNARGGSPHLHFEIHPGGGAPVNPYPTLRAYC